MVLKSGLQYILDHPTEYIYYFPKVGADPVIRMDFWDGRGPNPFHFSPPVLGDPGHRLTVLQRKDSPYRDAITQKLLDMEAAGLILNKFLPDTVEELAKLAKFKGKDAEKDQFTPFSADNMTGILIIHSVGLLLSTFVFLIELVYSKLVNILAFFFIIKEAFKMKMGY